MSNEK